MVRLHTVVWILTSASACGSASGAAAASPQRPRLAAAAPAPAPIAQPPAPPAPPPPEAAPPPPEPAIEPAPPAVVDAGVPEVPAEPPSPPSLACEPGTTAVAAPAPEPTWYCARHDGTRHGPFATLFPDGTVEISGSYRRGALDGTWQRRRPDGSVAETGSYAAGRKSGHWQMLGPSGTVLGEYDMRAGTGTEKRWLDDGSLYSERTLRAGVPSGSEKIYATDGTPVLTASWTSGKLDGPRTVGTRLTLRIEETLVKGVRSGARQIWLFSTLLLDELYDEHGKLDGDYAIWRSKKVMRVHGRYEHGKRDGLWVWDDRDGNKERQGNYVDGRRDGPWTEWADNKIVFTGSYVQGKPDGEFIYYDRSENELGRFEIKAGTGTMQTFWPNKKVASRQQLVQGAADGIYQELTNRGKVVVEGHYKADAKHGTWKEWTAEGVPTLEQTWKRGKLDGMVRKFADGKVVSEVAYKNGKATGNYVEYRDGRPAVVGQFAEDKKTGVWIRYDTDGRVTLTATYKDGVLHGPWHELTGGVVRDGTMRHGRRTGTWTETDRNGEVHQVTYPP